MRDGRGKFFLVHRSVTDNHDLIQHLVIVGQYNSEIGLSVDCNFLRCITDIGN